MRFKDKYRVESSRAQFWDYSSNGLYFVTILTKNRKPFFGEISNGKMAVSSIGEVVIKYWMEIPEHFPFVELDEFVVMPNHFHGILEISKWQRTTEILDGANGRETPKLGVFTGRGGRNARWQPGSLGVIINQFKRACTIQARKIDLSFGWHSRYHDYIIRDQKAFEYIQLYIQKNPGRWKEDRFFPESEFIVGAKEEGSERT